MTMWQLRPPGSPLEDAAVLADPARKIGVMAMIAIAEDVAQREGLSADAVGRAHATAAWLRDQFPELAEDDLAVVRRALGYAPDAAGA